MPRDYTPKPQSMGPTEPFDTVEQAWFWFIQAQQARIDGARAMAGAGQTPRPCEPIDILQALDSLYRTQDVIWDHLMVLRHYGRRMAAPDPRLANEVRAYCLWVEALEPLALILERKKIIKPQGIIPSWILARNVISIDQYREAIK